MPTGRMIALPKNSIAETTFHKAKTPVNGKAYVPIEVKVIHTSRRPSTLAVRMYNYDDASKAKAEWDSTIKALKEVVLELYRGRVTYWIYGEQHEDPSDYDTDQLYSSDDTQQRRRSRERR